VLVGLISLGAIAIDITLVALPTMTSATGGELASSGLIVTTFLAGFAPGQLVWGYVGDRYGRRPVVIAGLALFVLATIACALAPGFGWLLAARFGQGLTAGVGPVLARAITRDFATETSGARLLSLLTAVLGAAPLCAPLLGAVLLEYVDWRSIFWLTSAVGTLWFALACARLTETRRATSAQRPGPADLVASTLRMFANRDFRLGTVLVALPFAGYHSILALYPGVAIVDLGVSESQFAWLFAFAAAFYVIGSNLSRALVVRTGFRPLLVAAASFCSAGGAFAAIAVATGSVVCMAIGTAFYVMGVGTMLPIATTIALRHAAESAAWTAAVLGLTQTVGGIVASFLATRTGHVPESFASILCLCGLSALVVVITTRVGPPSRAARSRTPA
jgi:DHA1 family bicyclomycin/chloramphenicol resistance-like MFS transporter